MKGSRVPWLLLLGALFLDGACESGGLVGGDCKAGLTQCGQSCFDLTSDPRNCGACGRLCPPGVVCAQGSCGLDAGNPAGGAPSDAEPDQGTLDAPNDDAGPDATANGGADAGEDTGTDVAEDTGADVTQDTSADAPEDTNADVSEDTGTDAPEDTAADVSANDAETGGPIDAEDGDGSPEAGPDAEPCVPPYRTADRCGSCTVSCPPETPVCGWRTESYRCLPFCDPGFENCSGSCADLMTDPDHCGVCGHSCLSRLCVNGECVGASAGNVVAMCMDFRQSSRNLTATVMLGNAVFLAAVRPVRVLAYARYSEPAIADQVDTTIRWTAPNAASYSITRTSVDLDVPSRLNVLDFDVFLMYDQSPRLAPSGALGALGTGWRDTLVPFAQGGGTVIVLDGGGGEMSAFLTNAGLLEVAGEFDMTGKEIYVRAQTDALARRDRGDIVSPFLALKQTCAFQTQLVPDFENVFVVTDSQTGDLGNPVIVHRAMVPPP